MLITKRLAGAFIAACGALLLGACMFTPGKFDSTLTLGKGGSFAYVYNGEISMRALMQMAEADEAETAISCVDEETSEPRECTAAEIADHNAEQQREAKEKEQFFQMFAGGMDFSDPENVEKLVAGLKKQKGWVRVEYRDEGILDVRYETSGNLSHAFAFPYFEGMPPFSPFVTIHPRADGKVQVEAPGFGGEASQGMGQGMGLFAMMSGMGAMQGNDDDGVELVLPDGTFTIVTDGEILTNNTAEGPARAADGWRTLSWDVSAESQRSPLALIDLN